MRPPSGSESKVKIRTPSAVELKNRIALKPSSASLRASQKQAF